MFPVYMDRSINTPPGASMRARSGQCLVTADQACKPQTHLHVLALSLNPHRLWFQGARL